MIDVISLNSETQEIAASAGFTGIDVDTAMGYGVVLAVTVSTPTPKVFTAAVSDICTSVAHGFKTGLKVQGTTTTTLPGGLSLATDYFVIRLSADTFSLASSLVLAQAGTAINITDTGTGVHTLTSTALAGCSVKLQGSNDDSVYADFPISGTGDIIKTQPITASGNLYLEKSSVNVKYIRCYYTLTAGQISVVQSSLVKG